MIDLLLSSQFLHWLLESPTSSCSGQISVLQRCRAVSFVLFSGFLVKCYVKIITFLAVAAASYGVC